MCNFIGRGDSVSNITLEFLKEVNRLHPVTSTFHTPVYSNMAFQILAYALEEIAGESFVNIFQFSIIDRLRLNGTSLQPPNSTQDGIIPGDEVSSWWSANLGDASPYVFLQPQIYPACHYQYVF